MNGFNKVILMGTAGADAEVKTLEGGNVVASMNIAVNESYTDKEGNRQTKTEWVRIEAWRGLATFLGNYGKKGSTFLIEGKIKTDSWEQDGQTRYSTKVVANGINFAGSKPANAHGAPAPAAAPVAQPAVQPAAAPVAQPTAQPTAQPAAAPVAPAPAQATQQVNNYVTNEEFTGGMPDGGQIDDLPF